MKYLFTDAAIINEGRIYSGYLATDCDRIAAVGEGKAPVELRNLYSDSETISLEGCWLIPGVIDDQVHFRDPGLTHKGDIATESRAAAAGGVTSFMDMPNTRPATVTLEAWEEKMKRASEVSCVNYSFFAGATNDNVSELKRFDRRFLPGIKVFMGSSTGNMLVDNEIALSEIFSMKDLVAIHSESETLIRRNAELYRSRYGEGCVPMEKHSEIRSSEACSQCTAKAISLAREKGTRLHILHLSTADEASMLQQLPLYEKRITAEVCVHHLWFTDSDYKRLGSKIKCNPAIKSRADRDTLRAALRDGRIDIVATDHAPHLPEEKRGDALSAASGLPLVQFSLPAMMELALKGVFSRELVVKAMCHNSAILYGIRERGFLRPGMKADLCVIDPREKTLVNEQTILSRCGWSPFEGHEFPLKVVATFVNGNLVWDGFKVKEEVKGEPLEFYREDAP